MPWQIGTTNPNDVKPNLQLDVSTSLSDAACGDAFGRSSSRLKRLVGRPDVERVASGGSSIDLWSALAGLRTRSLVIREDLHSVPEEVG